MTKSEIASEALARAEQGQSFSNYPAIFEGFAAKGIDPAEIQPRENVLTFHAWRAKGRTVRKGEHGVKVTTFVVMTKKDASTGDETTFRKAKLTTVFHVSQTDPLS